ncbi:hypothetical protein ACQP2P_23335 [Dactylosporangium sp. CA-139114]|uniref:hypothetical protein n=1 Tax=Dactylosporangium sp. CA-139114 TaxID=3239931 RepID=UPI003D95F0A4
MVLLRLADVTDFSLDSGDVTDGIWRSGEITLPDLCSCQLDVEITDQAGGHVTLPAAGYLTYSVQMYFDNVAATGSVTYGHRDMKVSGRLMGRWPGTQAIAPVGAFPVELMTGDGDIPETMSGADGRFAFTTQVQDQYDDASVYTGDDPARPYYAQAFAQTPAPLIKQAPTRLTMRLDRRTVIHGDPIAVSGNLSWKSPTGWQPWANTSVVVASCLYPTTCVGILGRATTDAAGNYSLSIQPGSTGTLRAGAYSPDPFITTNTTTQTTVTVVSRVTVTNVLAVRDTDNGKVYVQGQLEFAGGSPAGASVDIQYSKTGTGNWHTVATIDLPGNPTRPFSQEFDQPAAGSWRIRYVGEPKMFTSATSTPAYVA